MILVNSICFIEYCFNFWILCFKMLVKYCIMIYIVLIYIGLWEMLLILKYKIFDVEKKYIFNLFCLMYLELSFLKF